VPESRPESRMIAHEPKSPRENCAMSLSVNDDWFDFSLQGVVQRSGQSELRQRDEVPRRGASDAAHRPRLQRGAPESHRNSAQTCLAQRMRARGTTAGLRSPRSGCDFVWGEQTSAQELLAFRRLPTTRGEVTEVARVGARTGSLRGETTGQSPFKHRFASPVPQVVYAASR
jgi:hypothetical protein